MTNPPKPNLKFAINSLGRAIIDLDRVLLYLPPEYSREVIKVTQDMLRVKLTDLKSTVVYQHG